MPDLELRPYPPSPHQNWAVMWSGVRVGTVEKIGARSYLVTGHPSRRNWTVSLSLTSAKDWLDEHAEELIAAGV